MRGKNGFTLIEMVMVIVILGILAVVAVPRYTHTQAEQREEASEVYIGALQNALSAHIADHYLRKTPWVTSGEDVMRLLEHRDRRMPEDMTYAEGRWTLEKSGMAWKFSPATDSASPRIVFLDKE